MKDYFRPLLWALPLAGAYTAIVFGIRALIGGGELWLVSWWVFIAFVMGYWTKVT